MYTAESTKAVQVTRELAHEFSNMESFFGERPLDQSRLRKLDEAFSQGRVLTFNWAVAILGGRRIRINGNHSSHALMNANGHFPHRASAVITEYRCDTMDDVTRLWRSFDPGWSVRGVADQIHSGTPYVVGTRAQKVKAVSGMLFSRNDGRVGKMDPEYKITLLNDEPGFVAWYVDFAFGVQGKRNGRGRAAQKTAICAAMYRTWRVSPSGASSFWEEVFSESNPNAGSPSRVLIRNIREHGNAADPDGQRAMLSRSINAWNNWRANVSSISILKYHRDSDIPKAR